MILVMLMTHRGDGERQTSELGQRTCDLLSCSHTGQRTEEMGGGGSSPFSLLPLRGASPGATSSRWPPLRGRTRAQAGGVDGNHMSDTTPSMDQKTARPDLALMRIRARVSCVSGVNLCSISNWQDLTLHHSVPVKPCRRHYCL